MRRPMLAAVVGVTLVIVATRSGAGAVHPPPHDFALDTFVPVVVAPVETVTAPHRPPRVSPLSTLVHVTRHVVIVVHTVAPPVYHAIPTVADAQAWALARLGATQYACLTSIVLHEDRLWNPYDTNSSSGAYGIPQAVPGSKMASAGVDWRWNRITQVKWMIGYVDGRYGSACAAAAFRNAHGWY